MPPASLTVVTMSDDTVNAAERYKAMETGRSEAMTEAFKSALLTLPYLFPEDVDIKEQSKEHQDLPKPWQSLGGRGVNTLTAKLTGSLLPSGVSFVRHKVNPAILEESDLAARKEEETNLEIALAAREREIVDEVEVGGHRVKWNQTVKQLIVTGNAVLYVEPEGGSRVYKLNSYVCRRDTSGNLLELVLIDVLDRASLTEAQQKLMAEDVTLEAETTDKKDRPAHLYTHIKRINDKRFRAYQELNGKLVPGSEVTFKKGDLPWLVLRFTAIDGDDYGRGFIEDYRGDLLSFDELSKSLIFAALNAARLIVLVKQGGSIKPADIEKALNGAVFTGEKDDVTFVQVDKSADMSFALSQARELAQNLAADFLLNSSFQRNAERVTAEEIRRMAAELDETQGGIYTQLGEEGILPFARLIEAQLVRRKVIEKLPDDSTKAVLITGLAAVGRGQEFQSLLAAIDTIVSLAPSFPTLSQYIVEEELIKRIMLGPGVDMTNLLKTGDEVAQELAQQQESAQAASLTEAAVKGAAGPVSQGFVDQAAQVSQPQGSAGAGGPA